MWIVLKYKKKNLNLLKTNLIGKIDANIKFYIPKIKFVKRNKKKEKNCEYNILYNYIFCFSDKFKDKKNLLNIQYLQGLENCLFGFMKDQLQIDNFISFCKKNESLDGGLSNNFFLNLKIDKAKFLNGPFANLIFDILERNKKQLKILLNNKTLFINNSSNNLYCLV